jgi:hypothetical protein
MSNLAPNLFDRRFQELVEIGRARLPSLAPEWTDYNAHDPGITLMELLAWVAEAQLYSLSRMRRDEREAYAALLGLAPAGTQGARGLIWPDRLDSNSPASTYVKTATLSEDAVINLIDNESPTFRPLRALLWSPGRIERLETRAARDRAADLTSLNERGVLPFMPFGENAGRRKTLSMTFECRDQSGLFGANRQNVKGAFWPIGVLAAPPLEGAGELAKSVEGERSPLTATLVTGDERFDLRIESDSTQGLLTTGAILLDLDNVENSPNKFTIELCAPNGLARPPRVLRIEPNVIPILQGYTILREQQEAAGIPDWSFSLKVPGVRFASGAEPVIVEVAEPTGEKKWSRSYRLSECGPDENVYEFDIRTRQITFGNGINGRIPPARSQVFVSYSVSDGEKGSVARNRKWRVAGFEGVFGVNPDPVTGGLVPSGWIEQRREARRRSRDDHALVSLKDIESAAKGVPLLEVARAWIVAPADRTPQTGVVTLVAMRSRPDGNEPAQPPETARWLDAIRRQLVPRMPLGSRLLVVAPRYIDFSIHVAFEIESGRNPTVIKKNVEDELKKRLGLVDSALGVPPRQPGVPVTSRDVKAWIRASDGVKRVIQLQLRDAGGKSTEKISVPRSGLPRWIPGESEIDPRRPETGGSQ